LEGGSKSRTGHTLGASKIINFSVCHYARYYTSADAVALPVIVHNHLVTVIKDLTSLFPFFLADRALTKPILCGFVIYRTGVTGKVRGGFSEPTDEGISNALEIMEFAGKPADNGCRHGEFQ
jgi:hypothetical protein